MSPGYWCDTLSKDRALTAAMQLHKDACLMKSNLDILDQYALALHGTASTILQRSIGCGSFPGAEVLAGAPRGTCRKNIGTNGGAWTLETYAGPNASNGNTILNECGNTCKMTMNIKIMIETLPLS